MVAGANAQARAGAGARRRGSRPGTYAAHAARNRHRPGDRARRTRATRGRDASCSTPRRRRRCRTTLAQNVDILVVNEHEAAICGAGMSAEAYAARMHARFGTTWCSRSARVAPSRTQHHLAPPTVQVVDTTGAGDAFAGALAAALDRAATLPEALLGRRRRGRPCLHVRGSAAESPLARDPGNEAVRMRLRSTPSESRCHVRPSPSPPARRLLHLRSRSSVPPLPSTGPTSGGIPPRADGASTSSSPTISSSPRSSSTAPTISRPGTRAR